MLNNESFINQIIFKYIFCVNAPKMRKLFTEELRLQLSVYMAFVLTVVIKGLSQKQELMGLDVSVHFL